MADTHYVLVIHGTWNPPNPTAPTWHQLNESDPQNFCTKLNDELEIFGYGRPVWRGVDAKEITFGWSGANQHSDRIVAAEDLYKLIHRIVDEDPSARIHFVAHSHGANVLLHALSLYLKELRREGRAMFDEARRDVIDAERHAMGTLSQMFLESARMFREATTDYTTSLQTNLEGLVRGKIGHDATHRLIQTLPQIHKTTFADRWMTFDASNRIGRLVFLGPPFFTKTWMSSAWWSPSLLLAKAFNFMCAIKACI